MQTFAENVNHFNSKLIIETPLPNGVGVMNPFSDPKVYNLATQFYRKYYHDHKIRKLILGINPGRLGAGLTGIPFTDPVKLLEDCGIPNQLKKVKEPSAGFIHDMIYAFGGLEHFYTKYFINSVCPLGFTFNGINYNYYDSKQLESAIKPFIIKSLRQLLAFNVDSSECFCLGNGKNFKFLKNLNNEMHFFKKVTPLPHPRWIVQYRQKQYQYFIHEFIATLK
ncbi:MAG: DUF4918 family protein [Bacteroidales bacterium]|nr:DUF4918 family protein [Bacteroidales bacterium]MCF8405999.1 DUF4918 family protein [Bacteroidales bacterium]